MKKDRLGRCLCRLRLPLILGRTPLDHCWNVMRSITVSSSTIAPVIAPVIGGNPASATCFKSWRRLLSSATSQSRIRSRHPPASASAMSFAASGWELALRETSTTFLAPLRMIHWATARPIPPSPPDAEYVAFSLSRETGGGRVTTCRESTRSAFLLHTKGGKPRDTYIDFVARIWYQHQLSHMCPPLHLTHCRGHISDRE